MSEGLGPIEVEYRGIPSRLRFRENFTIHQTEVQINGVTIFRNREYRAAASWAERAFNLTEGSLLALYRDYKNDFDS